MNKTLSAFVLAMSGLAVAGCSKPDPTVFSTDVPQVINDKAVTGEAQCSLDSVAQAPAKDSAFTAQKAAPALFSGWAWSKSTPVPSDYVVVRLQDDKSSTAYYAYTSSRGLRGDVSPALGLDPQTKVAFELGATKLPNASGNYKIQIMQVWSDHASNCDLQYTLHIN